MPGSVQLPSQCFEISGDRIASLAKFEKADYDSATEFIDVKLYKL